MLINITYWFSVSYINVISVKIVVYMGKNCDLCSPGGEATPTAMPRVKVIALGRGDL